MNDTIILKEPDTNIIPSYTPIGDIIGNIIAIIIMVGGLTLLGMLVWGAFEWLTSGGEKEKIMSARARIIYATIGIVVLAIAALLANLIAGVAGINIFDLQFPTLKQP
ncbi:hypothetical protein HYS91_01800 [Candidatus Daviesbacteria bacterium]|nr:hypothetical protein [Candidatus Daviesbacteria bacterium]